MLTFKWFYAHKENKFLRRRQEIYSKFLSSKNVFNLWNGETWNRVTQQLEHAQYTHNILITMPTIIQRERVMYLDLNDVTSFSGLPKIPSCAANLSAWLKPRIYDYCPIKQCLFKIGKRVSLLSMGVYDGSSIVTCQCRMVPFLYQRLWFFIYVNQIFLWFAILLIRRHSSEFLQ